VLQIANNGCKFSVVSEITWANIKRSKKSEGLQGSDFAVSCTLVAALTGGKGPILCLIEGPSSARRFPRSVTTARFLSLGNSHERARKRFNGSRNSLAVNKLAFAAAGDQACFAENFQVMRNRCRGDAAHRNDLAAVYVALRGNSLKNSQAGLVGECFRDFLDLGAVHGTYRSVADLACSPPQTFGAGKCPYASECNRMLR
jgi:hypothetical protein